MFKNAIALLLTPGFRLDPDLLLRCQKIQCRPDEARSSGFVAPCDHSTSALAHHVAGYTLICLETEDRLLPGSVVAQEVSDRAEAIEEKQGFPLGRKQMKELKERVIQDLLPAAFVLRRRTLAAFAGDYLIINTSSPARAELLLSCLRNALDQFPITEIMTASPIESAMFKWLGGDTPETLTVDDFCELEMPMEGKPAIAYKRTRLDEEDMQSRFSAGYVPRAVAVTYVNRLSFHVDSFLRMKKLSLLDVVMSEQAETRANSRDIAEEFDADVTLMVGEIVQALNFLIQESGGLVKTEKDLVSECLMERKVA